MRSHRTQCVRLCVRLRVRFLCANVLFHGPGVAKLCLAFGAELHQHMVRVNYVTLLRRVPRLLPIPRMDGKATEGSVCGSSRKILNQLGVCPLSEHFPRRPAKLCQRTGRPENSCSINIFHYFVCLPPYRVWVLLGWFFLLLCASRSCFVLCVLHLFLFVLEHAGGLFVCLLTTIHGVLRWL